MNKLRPCPFCGGKARLQNMGYPHRVFCEDCGARVTGEGYAEHGEDDAIRLWNQRRTPEKGKKPPWERDEGEREGDVMERNQSKAYLWVGKKETGYDLKIAGNTMETLAMLAVLATELCEKAHLPPDKLGDNMAKWIETVVREAKREEAP